MKIFDKVYDWESLYDLARDMEEAFQPDYNQLVSKVPTDKYGMHKGSFRVSIEWSAEEVEEE